MKKDVLIGFIILTILVAVLNPTHILMPETLHMMVMVALLVGFLMFIALVWREQASDERELLHIQKTGRLAFLVGTSITVIGIIWQALNHQVDSWLILTLAGMVLTKVTSRLIHTVRN